MYTYTYDSFEENWKGHSRDPLVARRTVSRDGRSTLDA